MKPGSFEPRLSILPAAQRWLWPHLRPAAGLGFALYVERRSPCGSVTACPSTTTSSVTERARIVLACLLGKRNDEVAVEVGVRPSTVGQWRRRFAERGIAGLRDEPRPGKPATYGVELRERVLARLESPPPAGMASWDGGSLAKALSVSDDAVWRVLRKEGIQLQRHRSWCVSIAPEFAAKAATSSGCT